MTFYDATQDISGVRRRVGQNLGIDPEKIRFVCPFVGGGFGSKGTTWSHVVLTAMAARVASRPIKLALERPQMFGPAGARPLTEQHLRLGADRAGTACGQPRHHLAHILCRRSYGPLHGFHLQGVCERTPEDFAAAATLKLGVPTFMPALGESSGNFALESAIDEPA